MAFKNSSNLDTANTIAQQKFGELFDGVAPGPWSLFTEVISSGAQKDNLVFASFLDSVREWLGSKEYGRIEAFTQTITLTKYERTIAIPRIDVEYDPSGAIGSMLARFIGSTRDDSDDKLVFDALTQSTGAGPTGFDTASLINDSHSLGGSTYDNKTTNALSFNSYDAAVLAMQGFKSASGEPLNIFPTTLVCGPKLRKTALEIAGSTVRPTAMNPAGTYYEQGATVASATNAVGTHMRENVFKGDNIDVVIWSRLTGTQDDYWYLMDLSKQDKPLIMKSERDWTLVEKTGLTDDPRFDHDKYVWSIEADKVVAAGAWPLIYAGIL